jgi:TetR/AcrR family transcriptional repressor of nem operon
MYRSLVGTLALDLQVHRSRIGPNKFLGSRVFGNLLTGPLGYLRFACVKDVASGRSRTLLAGLSKGSFYHYFSSKEDFGVAILQRYLDQEAERASTLLRASRTSPIKRLRKYFEELIAIYGPKGAMGGGCLLGNLSQDMANHSDLLQHRLQQGFKIWEAAVGATLQQAVSRGELSSKVNTSEMASFILNSYEGALLRAKADRNETLCICSCK